MFIKGRAVGYWTTFRVFIGNLGVTKAALLSFTSFKKAGFVSKESAKADNP